MGKTNKSIMQKDETICYLCGRPGGFEPLDRHHVFGGALRRKSEKYGLFVWLHHDSCHIFGRNSAHQSGKTAGFLHRQGQRAAMAEYGWSAEDFRREFYKNYV